MPRVLLSFIKSQRAAIIAGLLLTPFLIIAVEASPQLTQNLRWATARQPEAFSELYFAEPEKLPKQLTAGQATQFSFVITNHETADHRYRYQVLIIKNGAPAQSGGEVTLRDGESGKQTITIPASAAGERLQIVVRLPEKNQEIRFRAEVES